MEPCSSPHLFWKHHPAIAWYSAISMNIVENRNKRKTDIFKGIVVLSLILFVAELGSSGWSFMFPLLTIYIILIFDTYGLSMAVLMELKIFLFKEPKMIYCLVLYCLLLWSSLVPLSITKQLN